MANVIEIRVRATDETKAVYDKVKAQALEEGTAAGETFAAAYQRASSNYEGIAPGRVTGARRISLGPTAEEIAEQKAQIAALRAEMEEGGEELGEQLTTSLADSVGEELVPKLKEPIKDSGSQSGAAFVSAFQGDMERGLSSGAISGMAKSQGEGFSVSFSQGARDAIQDANVGAMIGDALGKDLEDEIPAAVGPSSPAGAKLKDEAKKSGQEAGAAAGDGMSPLLVSALVGGLAVGAPLILGAFGTLMTGVAGLALKNNAVIKADLSSVATTAEKSFTDAAAPLAGTMHQALVGLGQTAASIEPQLQGLFVNAEPDITAVASGVESFAQGILPGMSSAIKGSQVIVSDFASSLGPLGQGVGGFFQGLTRDAYTTGAGMESLLGTVGHLASTLGSVLGSAASVGSTALMGLDPVLNTTLSLIQRLANPGTVGAAGGVFAAMKFDPSIATGLAKASEGLASYAKGAVDAEGEATRLGSAASGLSGALSKGASIMSGPWGLAIGAGVGLAVGLTGALINASHASDALTLSQQGLQDAVAKDQGTMGAATAAYVAAQAQADGLAKSASDAGVSLNTWTQAVLGNKGAQQEVTAAVEDLNRVQLNAAAATDVNAKSTGRLSDEQKDARAVAEGNAAATGQLTDKNKQLLNSMTAQHQQIVDAINKQQALTAATNTLTNSTDIFAASLKAQYTAAQQSAQQSALNSVAAQNLGTSQTALSQQIYQGEVAYNLATSAAQGYATELQSINGTADSLAQAQNNVDQQLVTAKTTFDQNGYAITGMTKAAVQNRATLDQVATAIQQLGVAQEQATGDINKGNATIQQQIDAYVKATGATGKAKDAIEAYLQSLAKIPPGETTGFSTPGLDSSISNLEAYLNLLGQVGGSASGHILQFGMKATGGNIGAAATGGARGNLVMVGEQGPELARLPYGTTVIPNANVQSMAAAGGGSGGGIAPSGAVDVSFSGNMGDAVATMVMQLIRTRKIQIRQSQIQSN